MPQLAIYQKCTGCMACVDSCPRHAIKCSLNFEGHLVPVVDESLCISCGICEKTCPVVSGLKYSISPLAKVYAGWAKDEEIRAKSATAGFFAALAQYVLSSGGYVCGASIVDGIFVRHICIDKVEDLHLLQGSKYAQSDASGIYQTAYKHLKEGATVLFSGTGCQVAGLYGYLRKKQYEGILYTVDLICGGVPSRLLIEKFIENEPYQVRRIVSFRTKEQGWSPRGFRYNLKVEDVDGIIHDYSGKRNLVTTGFSCEMTNRYSCYQCHFAGIHRLSNFSIGDYWGIKNYPEQHRKGVSAIVAHNRDAVTLLQNCEQFIEVRDADQRDLLSHNNRIENTKDRRYLLPERRFMAAAFRKLDYKTLCKIYALDFGTKSPWMMYKVYRRVVTQFLK